MHSQKENGSGLYIAGLRGCESGLYVLSTNFTLEETSPSLPKMIFYSDTQFSSPEVFAAAHPPVYISMYGLYAVQCNHSVVRFQKLTTSISGGVAGNCPRLFRKCRSETSTSRRVQIRNCYRFSSFCWRTFRYLSKGALLSHRWELALPNDNI